MGRAERRQKERFDRIQNRKGKIVLSHSEISKIKDQTIHDASKSNVQDLMTCFALTEFRLWGFDEDKLEHSIYYINQLMEDVLNGKATIDDYIKELENETGIRIVCDE